MPENTRANGCLPFTIKFPKILVGKKMEHELLGRASGKFFGRNRNSEMVVPFSWLARPKWKCSL